MPLRPTAEIGKVSSVLEGKHLFVREPEGKRYAPVPRSPRGRDKLSTPT